MSARQKASPFKVAWIYPGPHNDGGWSQAHEAGRLYVQKMLGDKVQTTYKENVFSNASIPQVVAGLVRDGYQMIFGCSFGNFSLGVNGQLYAKYPKVLFEEATGTQVKKNQAQYFGAGEDTIYLSGMAAGAASKKGLIGYVVPYGTPEVVRHLNAFTLGAQATHPGAKVKIVWTNAWVSPPKETAAAAALASAGADVLGQNVDTPSTGDLCREARHSLGRLRLRREQVRAEAVADRGRVQLGAVLPASREGGDRRHLEAGFYYGSIKDGFTKLAKFGPKVSAKTRAQIAARQRDVVSGKFYEFAGPLYDQKGKVDGSRRGSA